MGNMGLIYKLAASFFWGIALHQTAPLIDALPDGWATLTRSAVGVAAGAPCVLVLDDEFQNVPPGKTRLALLVFGGYGAFGVGVVAAYILEHYFSTTENNK